MSRWDACLCLISHLTVLRRVELRQEQKVCQDIRSDSTPRSRSFHPCSFLRSVFSLTASLHLVFEIPALGPAHLTMKSLQAGLLCSYDIWFSFVFYWTTQCITNFSIDLINDRHCQRGQYVGWDEDGADGVQNAIRFNSKILFLVSMVSARTNTAVSPCILCSLCLSGLWILSLDQAYESGCEIHFREIVSGMR